MYSATAPTNIALIKYWGKKNVTDIIPLNESISVSLSLYTTTQIHPSESHRLELNGVLEDIEKHPRIIKCLDRFQEICHSKQIPFHPIHIVTHNDFPTASGLASSASGGAALVKALNGYFNIGLNDVELSILARLVSGSASRSVYSGFVLWSHDQPCATTLPLPYPECHAIRIPSEMVLYALVCILDDQCKSVPSSVGMQTTINTSTLFQERLRLVPQRILQLKKAIASHDYETLFELTMQDTMNFHATCLDTWPPITYLNASSFDVIQRVHAFNGNDFTVPIHSMQALTQLYFFEQWKSALNSKPLYPIRQCCVM